MEAVIGTDVAASCAGLGAISAAGANSYCDVRDVVAGILAALERGRPGRRYILAGETLSYFQAWRIFARVTGATPPMFPLGPLVHGRRDASAI